MLREDNVAAPVARHGFGQGGTVEVRQDDGEVAALDAVQERLVEMILVLVADVQVTRPVAISELLLDQGGEVMVPRKLEPGRVERPGRRQPGVGDQHRLLGLDKKTGMTKESDLHSGPPRTPPASVDSGRNCSLVAEKAGRLQRAITCARSPQ